VRGIVCARVGDRANAYEGATVLDEEGNRSLLTLANSFDAITFIEQVAATRANPTGPRGPESR
jgi:hypothetical protein